MNEDVMKCVSAIRNITEFKPKIALVLGSGLGNISSKIKVAQEISYHDIPGFPVSTAPGHKGSFIMGYIEGTPVICMNGRVHFYEGYSTEEVVLPVRVMHALGAEILFLTNAAGGTRSDYKPGDLVMITDHISLFVRNPLTGPNDNDEGVRFPDMSSVYDKDLQKILIDTASECGIELKTGVYVQLTGPSFETPAEIRMLKALGCDLVGMSTVMECIAARHMGMKVCGISLVSNLAAGISPRPLSSAEVEEAGKAAGPAMSKLIIDSVKKMS